MDSTTNQKPSQTENNLIILSVPPKWYEKKATHSSGFFVIVPISKFCVLSFHQLCIHGMDELISIIMQRFPEYPFQVGNRMDFAR